MFQLRPSLKPIFAGNHELRVGQGGISRQGGALTGATLPEQLFGLFVKLLQRRTCRKTRWRIGHDDLLSTGPRPHDGLKEDRNSAADGSVGSALSRGLEAPVRADFQGTAGRWRSQWRLDPAIAKPSVRTRMNSRTILRKYSSASTHGDI